MKRLSNHITYANLISTLCLFVLLGGGAYAAARITLPKNSVGAAQIKTGAVRSRQVKNGSRLAKHFRAGQLPAAPRGPQGLPGPAGPSEAFQATASTGPSDIALSPARTTVLQLVLAPGEYVLNAKIVAVDNSTTPGSYVRCGLFSDRTSTAPRTTPYTCP
jgi:hypothetical protein